MSVTGFGEQGSAVILSADEEAQKQELYKVNGFNAFASDKISLDRAIGDIRHRRFVQFQLNLRHLRGESFVATIGQVLPIGSFH